MQLSVIQHHSTIVLVVNTDQVLFFVGMHVEDFFRVVKNPRAPWRFDIPHTKGTIVRYSDNLILIEHCHASNVIGMA